MSIDRIVESVMVRDKEEGGVGFILLRAADLPLLIADLEAMAGGEHG